MSEPDRGAYRKILRSSAIMGAASVLNIISGLVKMKVVAVLLGPAGVGFVGLYQNLMQTAATVSALGFGPAGTRQIAAASADDDASAIVRVRRAVFWGTLCLALAGSGLLWLFSGWIAEHVLHEQARASDVAWLSLGVAFTVAAGSQSALLTGLRRIGDVARIQVGSGIAGAAFGLVAIWLWGSAGLVVMVIVVPVTTFVLGHLFVARLGRHRGDPTPLKELVGEWRGMAALGFALMLSTLITMLGQLAVRSHVQRELGADALGQFQAAWAIGTTYLGLALGAMGADYFPRLAAAINDRDKASRMVNEQSEVALLLCGPVVLAMLGLTPWVIQLLYSAEFGAAVDILRWQLLGDVWKVLCWPLGFVVLAAGGGKTFTFTQTLAAGILLGGTYLLLPRIGVAATGVAFLASYLVLVPVNFALAAWRIRFRWSAVVVRQAVALVLATCLVAALARVSDVLSAAAGVALAIVFGLYSLAHLGQVAEVGGRIGRIAALTRRALSRLGI